MALPPGYLALLEAADECFVELTRDEAHRIAEALQRRGWGIVAAWHLADPPTGTADTL